MRDNYCTYNTLVCHTDLLVDVGVPATLVSSLISTYADLFETFETLRNNRDYRTPSTIKSYMHFAVALAVLYLSPYWAQQIQTYPHHEILVYFIAVCVYLLLQLLVSLQLTLESPFDWDPDDISKATYNCYSFFGAHDREAILCAAQPHVSSP